MARNILYLQIISDKAFDPCNQDDISYLWNVWYDMKWSEQTKSRFLKELYYLCGGNLPKNTYINEKDEKPLINIWKKWLVMASEELDSEIAEKTEQQR